MCGRHIAPEPARVEALLAGAPLGTRRPPDCTRVGQPWTGARDLKTCGWNSFAAALIASAIVSFGVTGCGGGGGDDSSSEGPSLVRSTQFGQIEGVSSSDQKTMAWLGVPFAKPPVGKLRWQPPQDPDAWTGVKSAKDYGEACVQIGGLFGPPPKGKDYSAIWETFYKPIGSEDCLYLNIWSPAGADASAKLPVIVFIHGGSNVVGASFDAVYLGGNLAANANAVVVTGRLPARRARLVRPSGLQHRRCGPRFRQLRAARPDPVAEVRQEQHRAASAATPTT